ncbi:MAG TPA: hypothetical protein VHV82_00570 [Sporichthyaceae bacterium]|nr:hypothetical protein [Sporichthyaceae bacterium]
MSGRTRLRVAGIVATLFAMVAAVFGVGGVPAWAHSNGRAIVLVRQFTLTPAANGWDADVLAADFDSGAPLRNTKVLVTGGEPVAAAPAAPATQTAADTASATKTAKSTSKAASKTVAAPAAAPVAAGPPTIQLLPTSVVGDYQGTLSTAKPGLNHLELKIQTTPGGDPVAPFDQAWDVTLVAGRPLKVVGGDDGGGGSNLGLVLGVAGAVVGVALLYGLFAARRRTAVPAAPARANVGLK